MGLSARARSWRDDLLFPGLGGRRVMVRRAVAGATAVVLLAAGLRGGIELLSPSLAGPVVHPASVPPVGCATGSGSDIQAALAKSAAASAAAPAHQVAVRPKAAGAAATTITYQGVSLVVGPDAVTAPVSIGITPLTPSELPQMSSELTNVSGTSLQGWRFSPHPYKFAKPVEIRLPYDPGQVATSFSPQDVYSFFYDDQAGCWQALDRVSVDEKNHEVVSRTNHFTVMVNAVLTQPEYPQTASFNPTQIKNLQAGSPASGVTLLGAPSAANTGEAKLAYPIEVPPGRAGLQPSLAVSYDSGGGDGWVGQGWDVKVPAVTVDTRWGVPRYDAKSETESYLLNGEQLAPVANRGPAVARSAEKVFSPRMEGSFAKITRHGNSPSNYSWETVDKSGAHAFYGGSADSVLTDDQGRVFEWALREVRDTHGNVMRYHHALVEDVGVSGGTVKGRDLYLQKVTYTGTGTGSSAEGPYAVTFLRDRDLEESRRPDVSIDARGGFKRVTADLLRRVEVTMNDLPVRAYELTYTTGAFNKSLLKSIVQFGEDNQPFTTHSFGYHDDIRDGTGAYKAFAALNWTSPDDGLGNTAVNAITGSGGEAGALNATKTTSVGGHVYVGVGATRSKTNSAGVKAGYSHSEDTGLLALTDVDGDNLPDKVFTRGGSVVFRKNLSKPGGAARFSDEVKTLTNLPGILAQNTDSTTVGVEAYPGGVAAQLDHVSTYTSTTRYFTDVNGDGITDLVDDGSVLFGRVGADGTPVYGVSAGTPVPIGSSTVDTTGLLGDLTAERERQIDSHPLVDTVRRWVAPYDGTVAVTGAAHLIKDTSAERAGYAKADGVRLAIQHENDELWSQLVGAADYGNHTPDGVGAVTVKRGDRLYFRVGSRFDGAYDQVSWDPQIAYTGLAGGGSVADVTDVNGLNPYRYSASADFTLAGRAGAAVAPVNGTVHLSGALTKKAATTDDLTAVITLDGNPVFSHTMPAADTGDIPVDLDVKVTQGQKLSWRVQVDSAVDLSQISWAPKAVYTQAEGVAKLTDADGNPVLSVQPAYDIDSYPVDTLTGPQGSYTAPTAGTLTVQPAIELGASGPNARVVFTVKKRGALLAKKAFTTGSLPAPADLAVTVPVAAGDELFFDYSTLDTTLAGHTTSVSVQVGYDPATLSAAPSVLHSAAVEGAFARPYRGWGVVGYNGNRDRADKPITQTDLVIDDNYAKQFPTGVDPQKQKDAFAADPKVNVPNVFAYTPDPATGRWTSSQNTWAAKDSTSSSRFGGTAIAAPTAGDVTAVSAVPRMSKSTQLSLTGGVGGGVGSVGGSVSTGDSTATTDYLDLNGDGFPDVLGAGGVQYTNPDGTLGSTRTAVPDGVVRRTSTTAGNANAGSAARTITTGRGDAAPPASRTANSAQAGNDMPPLGIGGSLGTGSSSTKYDLLDINGDGLPDRVYADGRASLNLGYSFAAAEPWPGGAINDGTTRNAGVNVGFNLDFYGFAGGASYSTGHSSTGSSLLDVNGDGLADRVFDGSPIRVGLNTGSGFADPVPFTGGIAGINDDANAQLGGGVYVEFAFCAFFVAVCVIVNPGVNASTGIGRTEQMLRDINGDGFADQLRSGSDGQLQVAANTTGRTNLLKTVNRPMGSRIDLDYSREGNTYDQPQSRYVLSKVALYDGHPGDGQDTQLTTFRYDGGVYDRAEREFRGYRNVVTEQRDAGAADQAVYRSTTREYATDSHYTRGLLTRSLTADGAGKPYQETINSYQLRDVAAPTGTPDPASTTAVIFPQLVRTDQRFYEGQATPGKTTSVQLSYDAVGNVVRSFDTGDAGAGDDVETLTRYTYEDATCRATNIVGSPKSVDIRGAGALMRHREATVDCTTGDVKQYRSMLADGKAAVSDVTYLANGNVASVTGPANARGQRYKLSYTYEPDLNTYPASVTDSFGLTSKTSYNLKYGALETSTDVNGQQTRTLYDQVGRVDTVTGPYETASNHPTVDIEYHPEAATPYAITRNIDRNSDGTVRTDSIDTITFTDGLGRSIQTKKDATLATGADSDPVDAMTVSGHVEYDFVGRVAATSYPIREQQATKSLYRKFNTAIDSVTPTRIAYDILDRATSTTLPDHASTTVSYGFGPDRAGVTQFQTTTTDAKGAVTKAYTDVRRNGIAVMQSNLAGGRAAVWTSYGYDALGQITTVVDDHENVTRTAYDNFGRRTLVDTPDSDATTTSYDLAGNITATVTANLAALRKAITYSYDYGRLTHVEYPTSSNDVTYTYGAPGAANNGAGRVTKISDGAGTVTRQYGPLGETTVESRTVTAGVSKPITYTTRYQYDTWNRVHQLIYPDGEKLSYHYNSGGLVDGASGVKDGATYTYLSRLDYDVFEQRVLMKAGNGVTTNYTYNADDRRLATLQAVQPDGKTLQNANYTYDSTGNVAAISDTAAAIGGLGGTSTQTFAYDDLSRLTASQGEYHPASGKTDRYQLNFTYDTINITRKTETHSLVSATGTVTPVPETTYDNAYAYKAPGPHAPSTIGAQNFTYDKNGNLLSRTGPGKNVLRLAWDDADQLICSTTKAAPAKPCDGVKYVYDDQGNRVVKNGGSNNLAVYPSQGYTQRNSTTYKHVFIGDTRLVSKLVQPKGHAETYQYYATTDHLGSTTAGTDNTGKVIEHAKYLPSGESWASEKTTGTPSPYGFNGKELDAETGLYYYGARYYDPKTGVWQSTDPIAGAYLDGAPNGGVFNPTNLNAYTYAGNNPVRLNDPDGRWLNIAVGAVVGAVVGAAVEGYVQYRKGEFSATRLVGATAGGAVSGGLAGATLGTSLVAQSTVVVGSSVAGGVVTRAINGEEQTVGAAAWDAGVGLVTFGIVKGGGAAVSHIKGRTGSGAAAERAAAEAPAPQAHPAEAPAPPQRDLLREAEAARDKLGVDMKDLPRYTERPAVFVGAYDEATGAVNAYHSVIQGPHAEVVARTAMPNAKLTQPMGWRQPPGTPVERWTPIEVCKGCQTQFSQELFPPGTTYKPGGAWSKGE